MNSAAASTETMTTAAAASSATSDRQTNTLAVFGWITAALFPIAGIVIGAILASRGDNRGRYILGISIAIQLIWVVSIVLLLQSADDAAPTYYEPY
jgi:hypothetical protein